MSEVIELIQQLAAVPSFSHQEDRLHPLVRELLAPIPGVQIEAVPTHNLVVTIPSASEQPPIALTAHLDKIDHYGTGTQTLDVSTREGKIVGPMDDSVGLGLCIALARAATRYSFPPLLLLLSEQEECGGAGARNISAYLLNRGTLPAAVVTIDTTPLFRGQSGLAIYCAPWERSGHDASSELRSSTSALRDEFLSLAPDIRVANNGNDYVTYGAELNPQGTAPTPSIALEPSIFPYHCQHEEVFTADVLRLEELLTKFLCNRAAGGSA